LPKEIFKEPFRLLPPKVRSPSHFFRSSNKILRGQSGVGGGGLGGVRYGAGGKIWELWGGGPGRELPLEPHIVLSGNMGWIGSSLRDVC